LDILQILRDAVNALPAGDHSTGLNAILRHVSVAIRHYQDGGADPHSDRFTDSVYRTNQAYEGSLKEAYRVLAGKDPSKKAPDAIEKYLDDNKILRPRVLTQITRYRQDYRNPSAHDHRLDFDQNEALLAIVATCSFSKLLVDQIHERLFFNKAKDNAGVSLVDLDSISDPIALARAAAKIMRDYLNNNPDIEGGYALTGSLSGVLSSAGFTVVNDMPTPEGDIWDIVIIKKSVQIPIEVRSFQQQFDTNDSHGLGYLKMCLDDLQWSAGINVVNVEKSDKPARILSWSGDGQSIFVVTRYSDIEANQITDRIDLLSYDD
jgi:hypothetical protein